MSTIREVQLCGLEILRKVVEICQKHSITYYLAFGTLLGGVRHEGFIPWDNDIDIEMPIEDYKRFLRIAPKELGEDYFLQTYRSDPCYNEMWAKVRKNGTTSLPVAWKDYNIHFGIGIDIFPLVGIYDNPGLKKLQEKLLGINRAMLSKDFVMATGMNWKTNTKIKLLFHLPLIIRHSLCDIFSLFIFKPFKGAHTVSAVWCHFTSRLDVNRAYSYSINLQFEHNSFNAPQNYDYILSAHYGDYMTPPPEEERNGHEGTLGSIIYDTKIDYRNYLR